MRCDEEELELWYRLRAVKEFVASIGKREQNVAGSLVCSSLGASERQSWGIIKRRDIIRFVNGRNIKERWKDPAKLLVDTFRLRNMSKRSKNEEQNQFEESRSAHRGGLDCH